MPRTVTEIKEVWSFDELTNRAKERARDWYRDGACYDGWYEFVYEDAAQCAKILGIDLNQKLVKLMNGSTRYDPCIWFSGFNSQGDGACFEGSYAYAKGSAKAIRKHAPQDAKLHAIADELQAIQSRHFYRLEARVRHSGHYYHSNCTDVDVTDRETGNDVDADTSDAIASALRSFMDWIYRQLESEHDYLNSDEQVDESIRANEYEFDEDGGRI